MSKNIKVTSKRVASLAAETLSNASSSQTAKRLAASALSQRDGDKQTGVAIETLASNVLKSDKYADATKELAATVLSQSNKDR